MPPKPLTAYWGRRGEIVSLLVLLPPMMTVVFLTQSFFVLVAAYAPLVLLLVLTEYFRGRRRMRAMLSERFNGEALLSYVRESIASIAVVCLIIPISLALSLALSKHAVLAFKDSLYPDTYLDFITFSAETIVTTSFSLYTFYMPITFAFFCLCMKPEGATATPRQLLLLVYSIATFFIFLSGEGWVFERMYLLSLNISGNELPDPAPGTVHTALVSIVGLVVVYCHYKIFIALLENLVSKDKKLQFRRSMFKHLLKEDEQEWPKLYGVIGVIEGGRLFIERRGLSSVIVVSSSCLLAIVIYLMI